MEQYCISEYYSKMNLFKTGKVSSFIRNANANLCVNCTHFIRHPESQFSNSQSKVENTLSRCKLFGEMNIISGELEYDYAIIVRTSDNKCGNSGKYFENKEPLK